MDWQVSEQRLPTKYILTRWPKICTNSSFSTQFYARLLLYGHAVSGWSFAEASKSARWRTEHNLRGRMCSAILYCGEAWKKNDIALVRNLDVRPHAHLCRVARCQSIPVHAMGQYRDHMGLLILYELGVAGLCLAILL